MNRYTRGNLARLACSVVLTVTPGLSLGESIVVPAPKGFVATSTNFPEIFATQSHLMAVTPMNEVELYITSDEAAAVKRGERPPLAKFLSEEEPKSGTRYTESQFEGFASHLRQQGAINPSDAELASEVAKASPNDIGPNGRIYKSFSITGVVNLGMAVDQKHAIGTTRLMKLTINGETVTLVMASAVVYVAGRVIGLKVFSRLDNVSDVTWVRSIARNWATLVVNANP